MLLNDKKSKYTLLPRGSPPATSLIIELVGWHFVDICIDCVEQCISRQIKGNLICMFEFSQADAW